MELKFNYFKEILYLLGKDRSKLPLLIIFFIFNSLLDLVGIGLIGPYVAVIIDPSLIKDSSIASKLTYFGIPQEQNTVIIIFGIVLLFLFLVKGTCAILLNRSILRYSLVRTAILRNWLTERFQQMDYLEFLSRNSSEYIMATNNYAGAYTLSLKNLLKITSEGIVFVVIIALLIYTDPYALLLLIILMLIPIGIFDIYSKNKLRYAGKMQNRYNVQMIQLITEGIEGIKEIRVFEKELYFRNKVKKITEKMTTFAIRTGVLSLVPRYLLELVLVSFLIIFIILTVILGGEVTKVFPTLGVFSAAALRLLPTSTSLTAGIAQLRVHRYGVGELYKDLCKFPEKTKNKVQANSSFSSKSLFNNLELQNVSFNYQITNKNNNALTNISLKLTAGESIGLIGASGSGKTTLLNMILGFLRPQRGDILFNGNSIYIDMSSWLNKVAYLPQDIFLIDDKLINNIALGVEDSEINLQKINSSIKMARLHDLVEELPKGLKTKIGQHGARLSGGQRQRIALARAFYHQREIIIMDESTSALDTETETEIIEEIKQLKGEITTVIITHRLSTLKYCDRIYKLDKGRIINEGTYKQIIL
jgi:ATP-binding cassette, subfamily B, bacterial PglK